LESNNEQEKLIKTYPLAEMLEKDEFPHNQAEYANLLNRESCNKSGNPNTHRSGCCITEQKRVQNLIWLTGV